jgi:hypothetical protein
MTLRVRVNTKIPPDTAELGRKLLPAIDPYRVIGGAWQTTQSQDGKFDSKVYIAFLPLVIR